MIYTFQDYLLEIFKDIEDRWEIVLMEDCIAESDPENTEQVLTEF